MSDMLRCISFLMMHRRMASFTSPNAYLFATVSNQVHEMELVRRKIFDLEQAQMQIKAKSVFAISL
jgi:hypothetical protein